MINEIMRFSQRPDAFAEGTGNIWTDPYIASQMLDAHLNKEIDAASRNEKKIDQTVAYLNEYFKPNSNILDLGCGPGLYDERLSRLGHHVTGVDFSKNSINYAIESAMKQNLNIAYKNENFLNLIYNQEYDAVMQVYGEINTFSDNDRDQIFRNVYNALKPEGVFIFDVTTTSMHKDTKETATWYTANGGFFHPGKHCVLESVLSYENDVWLEQYIVLDEEKTVVYRNWYHEYTSETIKEVMLKAGFSEVSVSEKLYGEEQEEINWLTVIAKK